MSERVQIETYEALCSALYNLPQSEFLGEKDLPEGHTGWFHIGEKPKDMRVSVCRHRETQGVLLRIEWRNYHVDPRNPLRGSLSIRLATAEATREEIRQPVEDAVVRVLEVYRDVLAEEGVAGQISDLIDAPEEPES